MSHLPAPSHAGTASAGVPVPAAGPSTQARSAPASSESSFNTSSAGQTKVKAKKNKAKKKKKQPIASTQYPAASAQHPTAAGIPGISPSTPQAAYRQPTNISREVTEKRPAVTNAVAGPSTPRFSASLSRPSGPGPNDEKEEGEISEEEITSRRSMSPSKRARSPFPRRRSSASPNRSTIPAPASSQYQSSRPPPRSRSPPPPPPRRMSTSSRRAPTPPTPPLPSPPRFVSTSPVVATFSDQQPARHSTMPFGATPVSSYHPSRPGAQQPVHDLVPSRRLSFQDERWRYENKLKKILLDGHSPAELRRRGAVDYVVDKVCKDINENARNRQQQRTDISHPVMPPTALGSSSRPTASASPARQPLEYANRRDRRGSIGSESEAEDMLDSLRLASDSPPPPARVVAPVAPVAPVVPTLPRPQSSWAPPRPTPAPLAQNAIASSSRQGPPPAIKVESYRPPPVNHPARAPVAAGSTNAVTSGRSPASSHAGPQPSIRTVKPVELVPSVSSSTTAAAADDTAVRLKSSVSQPSVPEASSSQSVLGAKGPGSLPPSASDAVSAKPKASRPDKAVLDAKIAARMAMLATRRKVMESQARRRAALAESSAGASDPKPAVAPVIDGTSTAVDASAPNATTTQAAAAAVATEESTSSLEDQVADLEKEIMGLRQDAVAASDGDEDDEEPMELDEPEEGEIVLPSPPSAPTGEASPPGSGSTAVPPKSLPVSNFRGTKRPNAEDMETRPKSLSSRAQPPSKRRAAFGGPPLRANRLLFHLDDESDDTEDSDSDEIYRPYGPPRITASPHPPAAGPTAEETQRLLAEKEESIRRLKEEIAAKLRIKLERKKLEREQSAAVSAAMSSTASADAPNDSSAQEKRESSGEEGPPMTAPAEVGPNDLEGTDLTSPDSMPIEEPMEPPAQETVIAEELDPPSSSFRAYKPLLNRYRQLASSPSLQSSLNRYSLPTASAATPNRRPQDLLRDIDHSLLASIILTRRLQRDPAAVLCPAEVGGGSCADPTCEGIHLRKGLPDTLDLVDYIQNAVSVSAERIRAVLTEAARAEGTQASSRKPAGSAEISASPGVGPKRLESLLARVAVLLAA